MSINEQVIYILQDCADVSVSENDLISDLPFDSLDYAELAAILEFKFNFKLSQNKWNKFWYNPNNKVTDLINLIKENL